MIRILEFKGDLMRLEQFLNTDAARLKWKVISVQKTTLLSHSLWGMEDSWIVTFEEEEV